METRDDVRRAMHAGMDELIAAMKDRKPGAEAANASPSDRRSMGPVGSSDRLGSFAMVASQGSASTSVASDGSSASHGAAALRDRATIAELSGTVLKDRYELGRVLGAGGMGAVFHAKDRLLDRAVAVKVMRPAFADRNDYVKRFLREAKAASKIRHRNVVVVLDYGEAEDGLIYSVMELLDGQDLEHLLRERPERRLPWAQARGLLIQIASGLHAAHSQGVIHRDIKPANCFVTEEDEQPAVKLVDFGIAKLDDVAQTQQITGMTQILGTPSYMAPELFDPQGLASPRSDVYSLGVVAYRMLTGRLPFAGETVLEVIGRACVAPAPPLRKQVRDLPRAVEKLVLQMLAKTPDGRPPDMLAVRERLQALPVDEPRRGAAWRHAPRTALVVAMLAGAVLWMMRDDADDATGVDGGDLVVIESERPAVAGTVSKSAAGGSPVVEPVENPPGAPNRVDEAPAPEPAGARGPTTPEKAKRVPKRPSGPASDASIQKQLERKIKANCVDEMGGERVTVSFFVTASGEMSLLTATPKDAAGECAKQQVAGTKFRPRTGPDTAVKIVVE